MKKGNVKKVILGVTLIVSIITTVVAMGQSWGDRKSEGIKESLTTALYNPARYAFDGDVSTFWAVETDKNSGWAEKYWEIPYEINFSVSPAAFIIISLSSVIAVKLIFSL